MAESPQGLHDSRFSGSGPHTTTRGASAPAVLGDLAAAERHPAFVLILFNRVSSRREKGFPAPTRNERPSYMVTSVFGVMSNHVGTLRAPMFGDFPASLTHSRQPPVAGGPSVAPLGPWLSWGMPRPTPLRTKDGDLAANPPPFLPPGSRGVLVPRAWRSRPGVWSCRR